MNPALASLAALVVAIVLSWTSRVNVGLVAMVLAWLVGVYVAGLGADAVLAGFPVQLFLTLAGVTLLFALAQVNGALARLARGVVRVCRGNAGLVPLAFFVLALAISMVGPGAIAATALLAPLAMPIGARVGVPNFLTALMVTNGANAGALSPFASLGVVANGIMTRSGLGGNEWRVWAASFAAHTLVSLVAYVALGGWRLLGTRVEDERAPGVPDTGGTPSTRGATAPGDLDPDRRARRRHAITYAAIAAWIAGVVLFRLHLGMGAFAAAVVLIVLRAADETEAIRRTPWDLILMVSGVTLLVSLLERTGGLDLFTAALARLATPQTATGVIAFVTGVISTYSSTSGVVLPAFLPTAPGFVEQLGGGDPVAVAISFAVGSALVDVSPLSTLGALCVAAVVARSAAASEETGTGGTEADERAAAGRALFRKLLAWGLAMTVVGALFCLAFSGMFAQLGR